MINSFKKSRNSKTLLKRRSVKRRSVKRRSVKRRSVKRRSVKRRSVNHHIYDGKTEDGYKIIFISDVSGSMNTKYLNNGKDDFYINTVNNFTNTINNKDILLAFDHDCVKYTGDKTSAKLKAYGLTDMRTILPDLKKEIDTEDKIKIYLSSDGLHNVTDLKTLFNRIYNVFKSSEKEPSEKEIHWIIRCYGKYSPEKILTTIAYMITSFYKSKFNCTITPIDDNNFTDFKDTGKYIQIPEEYYNTFIEKIVLNRLKYINFQDKNEFINPIIEKINKTMEKLKNKIWEDIWNAIYNEDLSLNIPKTLKEFDDIIYLIIDKYNFIINTELGKTYIAVYLELKSDPSIESINLKIDPTKINIKAINRYDYVKIDDEEFKKTVINKDTVKDIVFDLLFNKNYQPYLILKVKYLILDKSTRSRYLVTEKNVLNDYIIDPKYLILPLPMGGDINNCLGIKSELLKNDVFIRSIAKDLNYENVTDVTLLFGKIIESFLEYYIYSSDISEDDKNFCERLTKFFITNFFDDHEFFNTRTFIKIQYDAEFDFNTIQGQPQKFGISRTEFGDLVILTLYIYIVQNKNFTNLQHLQSIIKSFANFGTKPEDTDFKDEQASLRIYPLSILYIYYNAADKKNIIRKVGELDKDKITNYINKAFISINPQIENYKTYINNEYTEILDYFIHSDENLPTLFRSLIKHFDYDPNNNDLEIIARLLVLKLNEDGRTYTNNIVDLESDDNFSKFFAECKNNINKLYASSSVYESLVSKKKALWFYLDIFQLKKSFLISCKKLSKIYGIETKKIDQLTITWNAMHNKIINFEYNRKYEMKETRRLALPSLSLNIDDITMNKITRNWEFATITEENICKYTANKEINIKYKNGLNILNIGTTDSDYLNKFIELFYPLVNINTLISYIYNYKKEYTEEIYTDYLDNIDIHDRKKIENNIQLKDNYKFVLSEIYKFYTQIKTLKELKDCEKSKDLAEQQKKEEENRKKRLIKRMIQQGIENKFLEFPHNHNYRDYNDDQKEKLLEIYKKKEEERLKKSIEEIRAVMKKNRAEEASEKGKLDDSGKSMKKKISRKKTRSIRHNAFFKKKINTRRSRKNLI